MVSYTAVIVSDTPLTRTAVKLLKRLSFVLQVLASEVLG